MMEPKGLFILPIAFQIPRRCQFAYTSTNEQSLRLPWCRSTVALMFKISGGRGGRGVFYIQP